MRVSALQFSPAFMDVDANLASLRSYFDTCEADLAVIPELCTSGYFFHSARKLEEVAETRDGRSVQFFRDMASKKEMIVVAGFAEREDDRFYNSAVIALPDGRVDFYRKIHLFAEEKSMFTPGDLGFRVIEYQGLILGTMICYDWRFPEAARTLALKGAHVLAHPSCLVAAPELWKPVMRTRAFENRVFTVTADRNGSESRGDETLVYHGCSQITGSNGGLLADVDEQFVGWLSADIDFRKAERKHFSEWNHIFTDRRPETYEL